MEGARLCYVMNESVLLGVSLWEGACLAALTWALLEYQHF